MKKLLILPLAALALLAGCRKGGQPLRNGTTGPDEPPTVTTLNIVRKPLPVSSGFNYLTNLGHVDIIFTQGDYSLEVEGDSALLELLKTDFDSNLLTVSIGVDSNPDFNKYGGLHNVKMYLSSPDLQCVSICANGSFESRGLWKTENLQLGMLHKGTMTIGPVECKTFAMQVSEPGTITLADLHAQEATILSRCAATIEANLDVDELTIMNEGKPNMKLTGRATHPLISHPNDANLVNELR